MPGDTTKTSRYFIINKPRKMVSQFVSPHKVNLLGSLDFDFPEGIHAVGRLDNDSEGLLILTNNKKVTRLLFSGEEPHKRVYLVQVNNLLSPDNLQKLRTGVSIRVEGGEFYKTPPCEVEDIENATEIYLHAGDSSQYGRHTWLLITLYEGKYRQVRKMIGAINHRVKRLIRVSIEALLLEDMMPGAIKELEEEDFFHKLKIRDYK
ncbi:MAG: pseudouridine synthase [Ginsengibacter sp.]|jgi:23S rRNA pseudouridine2457 synthase